MLPIYVTRNIMANQSEVIGKIRKARVEFAFPRY